jgi:hypothetical protein
MPEDTERVFASTTWEWKRVKITAPPRPKATARAKRAPSSSAERSERAARRTARTPFTVQIQYRGGPEAWWQVTYAGRSYRFSGVLCFHDVMRQVLDLQDL